MKARRVMWGLGNDKHPGHTVIEAIDFSQAYGISLGMSRNAVHSTHHVCRSGGKVMSSAVDVYCHEVWGWANEN